MKFRILDLCREGCKAELAEYLRQQLGDPSLLLARRLLHVVAAPVLGVQRALHLDDALLQLLRRLLGVLGRRSLGLLQPALQLAHLALVARTLLVHLHRHRHRHSVLL